MARADIIALLQEGRSDRYIATALRTSTKRVRRIRHDLELPEATRATTITLEQAWTARTVDASDGHLAWAGAYREGFPTLKHNGINHTARRIAFTIAHGREPIGRVLAGCGHATCVHPRHVTDQPMRNTLNTQYHQIFGDAA
ncbi:hypothetical protein [Streptomyces bauhiniae]|uniref:Uncharacterized protein n=1 Tax=Streptomyces bauhiniae TaxID=2340725 RepID=A0A7K3QRA8_9ACTN|nr:hypothetical protein [Streptomyces bauhiniae]NEB92402.1 hypothetical protein [Streptomyces bauhiniae]